MPAFGIFSSIFSEKAFFYRNVRKIGLLDNFCTNLPILVNISVISSSMQGYMAVKGLKLGSGMLTLETKSWLVHTLS